MKSVLISIKPKYCELIASGKKTIEVRKTRPKIKTPFKCYIYCTYGQENENYMICKRGKVIGEFVCDWVTKITPHCDIEDFVNQYIHGYPAILGENDCLSFQEMKAYLGNKIGYDWHISDLKIYDKPKELNDFWLYNEELHKLHDIEDDKFCCYDGTDLNSEPITDCGYCYENILNCYRCWNEWSGWCKKVTRPPQSYMYVEEVRNERV